MENLRLKSLAWKCNTIYTCLTREGPVWGSVHAFCINTEEKQTKNWARPNRKTDTDMWRFGKEKSPLRGAGQLESTHDKSFW